MKDFIKKNKKTIDLILQISKWVILLVFLFFAFRYIDFEEMWASLQKFSVKSIILFSIVLLISRLLYAWRWQVIGKSVLKGKKGNLFFYFQSNTLAEFVSIVLPTSVSGEFVRVFKLNSKGNTSAQSTAVILIDRASGILGMVIVSIAALLLMGRKINFSISQIIPANLILPVILVTVAVVMIGIFIFFSLMRNVRFASRIQNGWKTIASNIPTLFISLGISIAAHITFSLSHIFMFNEIFPLEPIELIAVILTPQLARTIPVSVLGFSPGEGMMVASQMMAGIPREAALLITLISLFSRYFFALVGFIIEMLTDGIGFMKKAGGSGGTENIEQ